MQGLHSRNPVILPLDTEIERTIRQKSGDNFEEEEEELHEEKAMAEQLVNQPQLGNQPPPERRPMKQAFIPDNPNQTSCIAYQPEAQGNYYISPQILNALTHFRGTPTEDPNLHLREFTDLCKFQHVQGLDQDGIRMILFPFSLKDNARLWYNSMPSNTIHTWEALSSKFLKKFFPAQKTRQMRKEIQAWQQKDGDLFFEAWGQFNDLLLKCPHHKLPQDELVQAFYEGLNDANKGVVDSGCGGVLMEKSSEEAMELFETLSEHSQQFSSRGKQGVKSKGLYEVNSNGGSSSHMVAVDRKLDMIVKAMALQNISPSQQAAPLQVCAICSKFDHTTDTCPLYSSADQEQANYVGQYPSKNNPFSNTYNPGWRNHPNFSWSNNQNALNPQGQQRNSQQAAQPVQESNKSDLESMVKQMATQQQAFQQQLLTAQEKFMADQQQFRIEQRQINAKHEQAIQRLDVTMGQLAKEINVRKQGELPAQTIPNPGGHQQVQAVTVLRSGKVIGTEETANPQISKMRVYPPPPFPQRLVKPKTEVQTQGSPDEASTSKVSEMEKVNAPPFPQRLVKPKKENKMFDIFEILRKVQINIPLLDAIKQIPSYAKFLKDCCTNKRRFQEHETVALTEEVSAVLLRKLPPKLKDPGSFTIPCRIGDHDCERSLLDLGAGVNLMPYTVYEKLGLGELQPTSITLQLADRSIKRPRGILEDVLVKVGKFILPVDFIVLDMEEGPMPSPLPLILGRPFMRTANMKIYVKKGIVSMKVNGEKIKFKVLSQLPQDDFECFNACMIQEVVENVLQDHQINPLQATLTHSGTRKDKEPVVDNITEDIREVVKPWKNPPSHPEAKKQQLKELEELRHQADKHSKQCKGRTKNNQDKHHAKKEFQVGQKVWTYKSRFRLIPGKFKYQWFGPCIITSVLPQGTLEVHSPQHKQTFKVNGHRVKPYVEVNSTPRTPEPHLVDFKCTLPKE
jgi:hypothetical protein